MIQFKIKLPLILYFLGKYCFTVSISVKMINDMKKHFRFTICIIINIIQFHLALYITHSHSHTTSIIIIQILYTTMFKLIILEIWKECYTVKNKWGKVVSNSLTFVLKYKYKLEMTQYVMYNGQFKLIIH